MSLRHFICAGLAALAPVLATTSLGADAVAQQQAVYQAGTTASFTIFLRGTLVGVEQMAVSRTTEGWSILSTGRLGQPFEVVARKVEVRYTADWRPIAFNIDTTVRGEFQRVITT